MGLSEIWSSLTGPDFSPYWKDAAVLLAGAFAIAGAYSDVKDKRTGKFTIYGRMFLLGTVLSMIAGFWAQWQDNSKEARKDLDAQKATLEAQQNTMNAQKETLRLSQATQKIIQATQENLFQLTRILEPLGQPQIVLNFIPNCLSQRFKTFCENVVKEERADIQRHPGYNFPFWPCPEADWSQWLHESPLSGLYIAFYKNAVAAARLLAQKPCLSCSWNGDMYLQIYPTFTATETSPSEATFNVVYARETGNVELVVQQEVVDPILNDDTFLSSLDIPNSTVTVFSFGDESVDMTLNYLMILTTHGQKIKVTHFSPSIPTENSPFDAGRFFVAHVPLLPSP